MKLERAEVERVRWPLAGGGRGGAARGQWHERRGAVLVIHAGGARGEGEASPLPGHGADEAAVDRAADELATFAGALPLTIDDAHPLAAAAALAAHAREPAARFAIETAVLALMARCAGVSISTLLRGERARAAGPVMRSRVVDDALGAAAAWADGIRTLKLKIGGDHARALALVGAVREAVPAARLRLDVNQGWAAGDVDRLLGEVALRAGPGLEYVEEPAAELAATLRAPRACPLALDESLARADREDWLDRALASGALAALVLKPTVLGGLGACLALADRARAHGVDAVASHALEGPIASAAIGELARALGGTRAHGVAEDVP